MTQELVENSDAQKLCAKAEERRKLLQWMEPVSCTEEHSACSRQRNIETGRWIFMTRQYRDWDTANSASLWLKGQPGSGKTILASAVIDEIYRSGTQTLAYFYCDFRIAQTTNGAAVLRSLVVQLLKQSTDDWISKFPELDRKKTNAEKCPTDLGFLRNLLVDAAKLVPRPVLVIDALDECKEHHNLLKHLEKLAEDARLQLFVTSRIAPDIQNPFPSISLMDNAEQMQQDIRVHITKQLGTHERLLRLPEKLRTEILEKLLEKANGMFRWVQCQLDTIVVLKTPRSIREAIDDLPKGLDETYDRIIQAIEDGGKDDSIIAERCLIWLAGAFTPLTLGQLEEVIMIEPGRSSLDNDKGVIDPRDIMVACGSLVIHDEITGVIALSHYSVKEYLISRKAKLEKYQFSLSHIHADICRLSIAYLLCDPVFEEAPRPFPRVTREKKVFAHVAGGRNGYALLKYAVQGLMHLGYVSSEDSHVMVSLSQLHSELHQNAEKWSLIANAITNNNAGVRTKNSSLTNSHWLRVASPSLLFIPLQLGQPWMVESLVKQQPNLLDMDVAPGWGSPLIFTIAMRPDPDCQCLIILNKLGVDLNKASSVQSDFYSQTNMLSGSYAPISWAVAIGKGFAVNFLLSRSEVNLPPDILHTAVLCDKPSHEVVRELRQRDADVNFTVNGSSPLHALLSRKRARSGGFFFTLLFMQRGASGQDWLPVVKELVEPSCNLSEQDWTARTVLHIALDKGLSKVVEYLLEKNARLSASATLNLNGWSWAESKKWFPNIQVAVAAADQPCTRIRSSKVFVAPDAPQLVEFANIDFSRVRVVVVSAIIEDEEMGTSLRLAADLSRHDPSLRDKIQPLILSPMKGDIPTLKFYFLWEDHQSVSSRLFDPHQGDEVTMSTLKQLMEGKGSNSNSLFLRISMSDVRQKRLSSMDLHFGLERVHPLGVECVIDIYRDPLP